VPRADLNQVSGHQPIGVDELHVTSAQHRGPWHIELTQRIHRSACAPFGQKADDRIDDQDREYRSGLDEVSECERDDCRRQQKHHDDRNQLVSKDSQS